MNTSCCGGKQGHAHFTRAAGSQEPCPLVDFDNGWNEFMAAVYQLPSNETIESRFGERFGELAIRWMHCDVLHDLQFTPHLAFALLACFIFMPTFFTGTFEGFPVCSLPQQTELPGFLLLNTLLLKNLTVLLQMHSRTM